MKVEFFNSRVPAQRGISLKDAVVRGQADNSGLFIPAKLPTASADFLSALPTLTDQQIVEEIAALWLDGNVPDNVARQMARDAINFQTPLVHLSASDYILELFHGPTLAFKDFGARFLARLLSHFLAETNESQTILVATSGDTGSAVAAGFLGIPNIRIVVLYPAGRVSDLQELQMTTLSGNTYALKVNGTFDDCQRLVKTAFADEKLKSKLKLNSANSINMGRLIAQTFYYFIAAARLPQKQGAPVFVVPSGNFGNLCAGLFAMKMGLPVHHFVAGTNANDVFVKYLSTGVYEPKPSLRTISNAMDVGAPSNLERLLWLFGHDVEQVRQSISAYSVSDPETKAKIRNIYEQHGYVLDPHTAVGVSALDQWRARSKQLEQPGIVLSTAHPAKFKDDVEVAIGGPLPLPQALSSLQSRQKRAISMENSWPDLHNWLLQF